MLRPQHVLLPGCSLNAPPEARLELKILAAVAVTDESGLTAAEASPSPHCCGGGLLHCDAQTAGQTGLLGGLPDPSGSRVTLLYVQGVSPDCYLGVTDTCKEGSRVH